MTTFIGYSKNNIGISLYSIGNKYYVINGDKKRSISKKKFFKLIAFWEKVK